MKRKLFLTGGFASFGMLTLILDSKTAIAGAQTGIDLCIRTVVPSLFPFILLSMLLINSFSGNTLRFITPLGKVFGIPKGTEVILLTGFLGGYPTGAQSIISAYRAKQIDKETADRMLTFCNNAGPAFLFGMVAPIFPKKSIAFLLWGIHIISAMLVALCIPSIGDKSVTPHTRKNVTLSEAMRTSITVMGSICGWVIIFRTVLSFMEQWFLWTLPDVFQIAIIGLLELANGCCALAKITQPELRFILCSGMLAWGGVCVALQTLSIAEGLSMKGYLKGKLLQTLFSLLLSAAFSLNIWIPVAAFLLFLVLLIQKTQKRGSNPTLVGV